MHFSMDRLFFSQCIFQVVEMCPTYSDAIAWKEKAEAGIRVRELGETMNTTENTKDAK